MTRKNRTIAPFLSVLSIISVLFSVVFIKMEARILGYKVLKKINSYKAIQDEYRVKKIEYAKLTNSERLRVFAKSRRALKTGKVIQISGDRIAIQKNQ